MELLISDIIVNREARQRRELINIDELAASISRFGLIHPVVIDENNELIAGERRLTACKKLGWTSIPVHYFSSLSATDRYAIELEENIRRSDLSWQDRCSAIYNYHTMRRNADPNWQFTQTGEELNMTGATIGRYIAVQEEIQSGNELVIGADSISVAMGIASRAQERRSASESDLISTIIGSPAPLVEEPAIREESVAPFVPSPAAPLINTDFLEWIKTYSGPRFNLIHCDFPYGINADKHPQGAAGAFGGYEDSADVYFELLTTMLRSQDKFISESAHLVFWFALDYYEETKKMLSDAGWRVDKRLLIWMKSDNVGIIPDPQRGPRWIYETAFFASRGDRKIVRAVANAFAGPTTKEVHMSEKSLAMLSHFFRMLVDDSTRMIDPTCGSGNAVKAAANAGASFVLGLERDPTFYENAIAAWNNPEIEL